jgi:MFS transporter, ACS family, DAL5 transporter family protein
MLQVSVQLGNVAANFIYRTDDAPLYRQGNRDLVVITVIVIIFFLFTKAYNVLRNKPRDKKWNSMTEEVIRLHPVREYRTILNGF